MTAPEQGLAAKHIGIVAVSAEGAALCYRTICAEAPREMGAHAHPEVTMHTHPLSTYMVAIRARDWAAVAGLLLSATRKVAQAGAAFVVCPDNTVHAAFELVAAAAPIPWLHIAQVVASEAERKGFRRLGILGTRSLMESRVYPDALAPRDIAVTIPEAPDRDRIDAIILDELVYGVFRDNSRSYLHALIGRLGEQGCDAVVLGCTEIPLVVEPTAAPLPTLDSTRLLARAALRHALGR